MRYWAEVLSHVAAGHGVAPVAARAEAYHARPGIAFVPFSDAPTIDYGLLRPTGRDTPAVQALVTVLCETVTAKRSPDSAEIGQAYPGI